MLTSCVVEINRVTRFVADSFLRFLSAVHIIHMNMYTEEEW